MSLTEPHRQYRQYIDREDAIGEDRQIVLNVLLTDARGYDNRVSAKDLAAQTTVSASTVRDIVRELQREFDVPVASLGNGYFIIQSGDELDRVVESYREEIATKQTRLQRIVGAYNRMGAGR